MPLLCEEDNTPSRSTGKHAHRDSEHFTYFSSKLSRLLEIRRTHTPPSHCPVPHAPASPVRQSHNTLLPTYHRHASRQKIEGCSSENGEAFMHRFLCKHGVTPVLDRHTGMSEHILAPVVSTRRVRRGHVLSGANFWVLCVGVKKPSLPATNLTQCLLAFVFCVVFCVVCVCCPPSPPPSPPPPLPLPLPLPLSPPHHSLLLLLCCRRVPERGARHGWWLLWAPGLRCWL